MDSQQEHGSPSKGHGDTMLNETKPMTAQDALEGQGGFRASEIAFLQEQNNAVLTALENIESERDNTLRLVREWEDKEQ